MTNAFRMNAFHYAHRGLWSPDGWTENSVEAFRAAAEAGYGAELDVRPSADGELFVFHDPLVDRLTDGSGLVAQMSSHTLRTLQLKDSAYGIPRLEDILAIWPDHLPLLIEMKVDGVTDAAALAKATVARVSACEGLFTLMSFHPDAVAALPHAVQRGGLIPPLQPSNPQLFTHALSKMTDITPDYLACWHGDVEAVAAKCDLPLACWTLKSADEGRILHQSAPQAAMIFEHFNPNLALTS